MYLLDVALGHRVSVPLSCFPPPRAPFPRPHASSSPSQQLTYCIAYLRDFALGHHVLAEPVQDAPATGSCQLGFRPEAAHLHPSEGIPGVIQSRTFLGPTNRYRVAIGDEVVAVDDDANWTVGEGVHLRIDRALTLPPAQP